MRVAGWGARIGFFLAVITSASGLGNLWRFPYVVAENGGGGFVLLYLLLVMIVGAPLLVGELVVGRATGKSILSSVGCFRKNKLYLHIGNLTIVMSLLVLGYFSVISSWVLYYLVQYCIGLFSPESLEPALLLRKFLENGWLQLLLTAFHLSLLITVVSNELEDGLEKFVGYLMPIFAVLLCVMVWKSLSLESSEAAMRFLFYPDFSKLSWFSLSSALGQVLFSLSIGLATMVTFGSMLAKNTNVPQHGVTILFVDTTVSLLAGMLVFPLLIGVHSEGASPLLLFEAVPEFFNRQEGGAYYGLFFFLFLYLGAFGASLTILETIVVNFKESYKAERSSGALIAGSMGFVMGLLPALSISFFSDIRIKGKSLLVIWDNTLVVFILPIIAVLLSQWIYHGIPQEKKEPIFLQKDVSKKNYIFIWWMFLIKWVVPGITILAFSLSLIGFFRS